MIDVTNPAVYTESLRLLRKCRLNAGRRYRGRFAQIFLGLKFYQNEIPNMFSNQFAYSEVLQTMLDDLYAKASRPLNDCVLMLFENRYHARTSLIGPGNTTPQNTWRNNFHLQKGIGCYAPPQELSSQTFLDQSRIDCRYLQPRQSSSLSGASCQLCPRGAHYRMEDHRKWLRIDPGGTRFASLDLMNIDNYLPYVVGTQGRIPVLPLIVALFHDALPGFRTSGFKSLDVHDFADQFNFSRQEFEAYFDDAPTNSYNTRLLRRFPNIAYTQISSGRRVKGLVQRGKTIAKRRKPHARPPVLPGTATTPPAVNTGWPAEQFVRKALEEASWQVYDVSRQRLGYDLLARKGRQTRWVDVKSSVGYCSPSLTQREWEQARLHALHYVLAIIENFDPLARNTIFWIPDPLGKCGARETQLLHYYVARGSWIRFAVPLNSI